MARDTNIIRNFDALPQLQTMQEEDVIMIGRRRGGRGHIGPRRMEMLTFIIEFFAQPQTTLEFSSMLDQLLDGVLTFENLGAGEQVFDNFTNNIAQFKTLTAGTAITLDSTTTPGEIIINSSGGAATTVKNSIEEDAGDLQLVGDILAPGNNFYYGTDGTGTKSFYTLPVIPTVPTPKNSIELNVGEYQLVGDSLTPGNSLYYGTNAGGVKGFHSLPPGATDELVKASATDPTAGFLDDKVTGSIEVGTTGFSEDKLQLVGEQTLPPVKGYSYYGTDKNGVKGWYKTELPFDTIITASVGPVVTSISNAAAKALTYVVPASGIMSPQNADASFESRYKVTVNLNIKIVLDAGMTDQTLDKVSYRTWFNPDGSIPPFGSGEEDNVKLLYKDTGLLIQHNVFHKSFVGITDFLAAGQEIIFRIALNGTTGGHTHTYEKCEMLIERLD